MSQEEQVKAGIIKAGAALAELRQHDGYAVFVEVLAQAISDVGTFGLRDERPGFGPVYWRGYQDGLISLMKAVEGTIAVAEEVAQEDAESAKTLYNVRLGHGGGNVGV